MSGLSDPCFLIKDVASCAPLVEHEKMYTYIYLYILRMYRRPLCWLPHRALCMPTFLPGESRAKEESSESIGTDIVQFGAPIYYVDQEEGVLQLEVMRLGSKQHCH